MGTTLTAAYVGRGQVSFAHVGDSRAYRMRDGELERITEDIRSSRSWCARDG